ncbi:hypothetical protein [uncultured Sphingomonas sp.]|uniref:hypothetical protein n=1 Tax=uncultured Sphingomonas sp. TaxID=158754 RepID=UPI0025E546BA|nr:hypothetical protein [uncultured Sphingomonas sp.]
MALSRPLIIAPDTSHWANWIDAALGDDAARRVEARVFHRRLLAAGRVPFLSWHHLEEMLCVDSAENAAARVRYIQSLPLISWMRFPGEVGLGAVTDVLAAEAIAFDSGCDGLLDVRDHVRSALLRTGPAIQAVGEDNWVWDVARPLMRRRRPKQGMVTALSGLRVMDESQTFGQLASRPKRSPEERRQMMAVIHARALADAKAADPARTPAEARQFADHFLAQVIEMMPDDDVDPRQLMIDTYVGQGLDPDEITDDRTIADLSTLATFRTQLKVVSEKTDLSFERLKRVRMETLPSWRIAEALRRYGQNRAVRPGSDSHDRALAVLGAYTDVLYVDKRTHEDFRRIRSKDPEVASLLGAVEKARHYQDVVGDGGG